MVLDLDILVSGLINLTYHQTARRLLRQMAYDLVKDGTNRETECRFIKENHHHHFVVGEGFDDINW